MPHLLALLAVTLVVVASDSAQPANQYPQPGLLVEPADLAKPEAAATFRILDARSREKYLAGHIPGAVWVNHALWHKTFGEHQDPKAWAELIGKLGIDDKTRVVVYDDVSAKDAARIWWILRYWGHASASLVNGGWPAYEAGSHPVSKKEPAIEPRQYDVGQTRKKSLATKDDVLSNLNSKVLQILDARSEAEHCGDTKLAKRGGAIPDALNLEWTEAIDPKTRKFKTAAELVTIFKTAGIDLNRPTVTHCQSGGRASVMAFALELMGAKDVRNYYLGWSEWGNAVDTPVATPKKKS